MRTAIPANEQITYKKGVIPVLRALLFGYILSFALMAVTAVILWLSHAGDSAIRPIVLIITLAAMILSGRYAAKNTSFRGFVIGGAVGLSYMLILYFISILAFDAEPFSLNVIIRFLYAFVAGALGGVMGKNFSGRTSSKRKK